VVLVHVWQILNVHPSQCFCGWHSELKVSCQLRVSAIVYLILDESSVLLNVSYVFKHVLSFSNVAIQLFAHLLDSLCFFKDSSPLLLEIVHVSNVVRGGWIS
jgi:hypothetical protein